jgi:hypothetical protein
LHRFSTTKYIGPSVEFGFHMILVISGFGLDWFTVKQVELQNMQGREI